MAQLMVAAATAGVIVACGTSQPTAQTSASSTSPSPVATVAASAATASPPSGATTLYVLSPENGSQVGGTVRVQNGSGGATLTESLKGLSPGAGYLADADPLPCEIFVGGPSQSFASRFTADEKGNATVSWTVPAGMAANANVQSLTSQGTFIVVACADLG
jgi:hypothetical protein